MANTTALKRRIGSVKNTRQITKAMELVAASKMKRAQDQAISARPFRISATDLLRKLSTVSDVNRNRLFMVRPVKKSLILVITSDIGLAGAYDANVLKSLTAQLKENEKNHIKSEVITIGKKASQLVSRLNGITLLAHFPVFSGQPKGADIRPIVEIILEKYESGDVDQVSVIYTGFVSSIKQDVTHLQLLPTTKIDEEKHLSPLEIAIFEPNAEAIIESAARRLIEAQVWQTISESLASEHSARMLAMKNATDNASDIIDDLTLEFNTARQAAITQEIAEIVGGAEAVKVD